MQSLLSTMRKLMEEQQLAGGLMMTMMMMYEVGAVEGAEIPCV